MTGTLRRRLDDDTLEPGLAVGDWVFAVELDADSALVVERLPRRGQLVRARPGGPGIQCIAANVDVLWIASSCNRDLNPRRLERYLAVATQGGAEPVVVLTKRDLVPAEQSETLVDDLAARLGVDVVATSVVDDPARAETRRLLGRALGPGRTVALVGSSGVGKSSLINAMVGGERMVVQAIRGHDDRGRHTTTHRELVRLPDGGGLLIDTPGMRELGITGRGGEVSGVFEEIDALAEACRFRDCSHQGEPGCEVEAAVERGDLDPERLHSWGKVQRDIARTAPKTKRERIDAHRKRMERARMIRAVSKRRAERWKS